MVGYFNFHPTLWRLNLMTFGIWNENCIHCATPPHFLIVSFWIYTFICMNFCLLAWLMSWLVYRVHNRLASYFDSFTLQRFHIYYVSASRFRFFNLIMFYIYFSAFCLRFVINDNFVYFSLRSKSIILRKIYSNNFKFTFKINQV